MSRQYGFALSGGLDSSSITAGLNKVTSKTIIAQTVCFNGLKEAQDKKANEMEYALELTKAKISYMTLLFLKIQDVLVILKILQVILLNQMGW